MDVSTFCIESPPTCGVIRILNGNLIRSEDNTNIYHTCYENDCSIRAVILGDENSEVLKEDHSVQECDINAKIDWTQEYEIFLYCVNISNTGNSYICSRGFISDSICVEESNTVEVSVQNTPIDLTLQRKDSRSDWKLQEITGIGSSSKFDTYDGKISEGFSPHSEVVRIGIDNKMPDSFEIIYDSEK